LATLEEEEEEEEEEEDFDWSVCQQSW